jgi:hypothetical protein
VLAYPNGPDFLELYRKQHHKMAERHPEIILTEERLQDGVQGNGSKLNDIYD